MRDINDTYVYLIVNKINGKKYVGITSLTLEQRWKNHIRESKGKRRMAISMAIKKHGEENFVIEPIIKVNRVVAGKLEQAYIEMLDTFINGGHGYNMTKGGDGGRLGAVVTQETRKKLSVAGKGRRHSEETKRKIGRRRGKDHQTYGKSLSLEHRQKIGKSNSGAKNGRAKRFKVTLPNGKVITTNDRKKFCEDNNLSYLAVKQATLQKQKHKGFKFECITDNKV